MAESSSPAAAFAVIDQTDWNKRLLRAKKADGSDGAILPVLDNLVSILLNDERWQGVIAYDQFAGTVMKLRPPPYARGESGEWADIDDNRLELWLASVPGIRGVRSDALMKAVMLAADANRYHAVQDYLNGLKWDGTPRLKSWIWAFLGAERTPYVESVALKWLVGAVARVMRAPGRTKMDNVLILEGLQGPGKSTAFKALFEPWFSDASFDMRNTQESGQIIRGKWAVELPELDGYNRVEAAVAKAFFSREEDRYRNPYGRKPIDVPRQCVFGGSVNHDTYLKDDTGNRRYWPVKVNYVGIDELRAERDQLWAEALVEYKAGTQWWVSLSERPMFEDEQEQRYIGDAYETQIRRWLDEPDAGGTKPNNVSVSQLMGHALKLDVGKWTLPEQQRVGRIMARVDGWERKRVQRSGGREWVYMRKVES